jgi:hypothetical protein
LIRSGQSATGVIGTALAGEVTIARLPVSGAASGSRGVRRSGQERTGADKFRSSFVPHSGE